MIEMNNLLMNELGITETKVAVLDSLIKFSKSDKNIIKTCDLENIKSELIKRSSKGAINEAINFSQIQNYSQERVINQVGELEQPKIASLGNFNVKSEMENKK